MPQQEMPGFVRVVHEWTGNDRWAALACRLGRFGARSRVPPGLYALGTPGMDSPALVTASYRLTFDLLRRALAGASCWVLVLDTRGLDVASAAASGRFGTDELVTGLLSSRLERLVGHRRVVVPGAASDTVEAREVQRRTGFEAVPGPARVADLTAFLDGRPVAGQPRLTVADAAVLVPSEVGRSLLRYPAFAFAALLFAGLGPGGVSLGRALGGSWPLLVLGLATVLTGSAVAPLVYAAVPGIPLWAAGEAAGLGAAAALLQAARFSVSMDPWLQLGCWLFFPGASAAMAQAFVRSLPSTAAAARRKTAPALIAVAILLAAATAAALVISRAAVLRGAR